MQRIVGVDHPGDPAPGISCASSRLSRMTINEVSFDLPDHYFLIIYFFYYSMHAERNNQLIERLHATFPELHFMITERYGSGNFILEAAFRQKKLQDAFPRKSQEIALLDKIIFRVLPAFRYIHCTVWEKYCQATGAAGPDGKELYNTYRTAIRRQIRLFLSERN